VIPVEQCALIFLCFFFSQSVHLEPPFGAGFALFPDSSAFYTLLRFFPSGGKLPQLVPLGFSPPERSFPASPEGADFGTST